MSSNYPETTSSLFAIVQRALNEAINTRSAIFNLSTNARADKASFNHTLSKPALQAPPMFSDLFEGADTTQSEVRRLDAEADKWMERYFPAIHGDLKTLPEDFLCGIISGVRPFGIDSTIFEMVWQQARDRAYRTQASEMKTLAARHSSAGFSLPSGALLATLSEGEQRAAAAIAQVNVEQAIKDAEIKLELLKFAQEQAVRLKLGVLGAMADFYRMWFSVPDRDLERARVRAQAMGAFYQSLSSYHNVEASFERLSLESAKAKADVSIANARLKLEANGDSRSNAGALGQAASAFGSIASGAASAAGSLVAQVETI